MSLLASRRVPLHLDFVTIDASKNVLDIRVWVDDFDLSLLEGRYAVELSTESGVVAKKHKVPFQVSVEAVGASPGERVFKARLVVDGECYFQQVEARWFATSNNSYWTPSETSERIGAIGYPVNVSKGRGSYGVEEVDLSI